MSNVIYRVNCGSLHAVTDGLGRVWSADRLFAEGDAWGACGGNTVLREAALPILSQHMAEVLRSERHGLENYRFKVEPGRYAVRVYAAETFEGDSESKREFGVSINGRMITESFAPYRMSGGFARAARIEAPCRTEAPEIDIRFHGKRAIVNAIEIERADLEVPVSVGAAEALAPPVPPLPPDGPRTPLRMLFIGNSGTFYWDIPKTVAALINASASKWQVETEAMTSGGKTFRWHWERDEVRERIKSGGFDYVVLQDATKGATDKPDEMREYGEKLIRAVREAGSKPLLYAYYGPLAAAPENWDRALALYTELSRAHQATLVPTLVALRDAMSERPEENYHNPDRHHSGMHGAFLFASCFYRVLTQESTAEHPYPAVLGNQVPIPREMARFLSRKADDACLRLRPWSELSQR